MIYGLFTTAPGKQSGFYLDRIQQLMSRENCLHYNIDSKNFIGGYYLHNRLPYNSDDIVYHDKQNGLLIILSGAVYNNASLCSELGVGEGIKDPELISRLFMKLGPDFVNHLNGEFSICIYDASKDRILLFRDHLGIRPLAYSVLNSSILFSTDMISLCRSMSGNHLLNQDYLLMLYKGINLGVTPCQDVLKLIPGHYLEFSDNHLRTIKYWHPEKIRTVKTLRHEDFLADIKKLLTNSIYIRSDNRFTAGAHVSGGLDTGIIATLARDSFKHQKEFYGFSWSPSSVVAEKVKYDERELVIRTCEKANIIPVFTDINESDFNNLIFNFIENHGYYYEDNILELAAERKVNLMFSGFGGDEFISKADNGILSDLFFSLYWKAYLRKNPIVNPKHFIKTTLFSVIFPALGVLSHNTKKMYEDMARYLKKPFKKFDKHLIRDRHFYKSRREIHQSILESFYIPQRTEIWTVNGFYKGVEYRYPLLDKRIVEYMIKVPSQLLSQTNFNRTVIREISKDILPEEVRWKRDGTDPVLFKQNDYFIKKSAILCMDDIDAWMTYPDLQFIDFDALKLDVKKFKADPDNFTDKPFFYSVALIKAFHDFIKRYRS